ncbi:hypothetical protein VTN77DRAFT_9667 [Rasamsonia byssochlamydoides]|uniref:uncharacterized protein n=1 Tax=Rasamsonia byssochlamydoides TaxID=89139 RepID=UPI003743A95A
MARRIFGGRARAHPAAETISRPTLTFTDALPRDDLQDLGRISAAGAQPAPSSGWSRRQEIPNDASAFDFRVAEPPEEAVKSDRLAGQTVDDSMIGIALGSPGAVASPYSTAKSNDGPPPPSEVQATTNDTSGSLRRKPSKWKKFGGLFKGKQNTQKTSNLPFYQVQVNDQPMGTDSEFPYEHAFLAQSRYELRQDAVRQNKDSSHMEAWPRLEDESRKEQDPDNQSHAQAGHNGGINSSGSIPSGPGPFLQVDIPDIHMERYSVMFGSVLGNKQPAGLLERRSKTLDKLKVATDEPHAPEAHKPQRRATSPSLSKSPSFTLFPPVPAAQASKSTGSRALPNMRPGRSQTAPAESMETLQPKDQVFLTVPEASPAPSSAWSDASPLSSASEAAILKSKPTKSYVDEREEPVWEMVTTKRTESPESMTLSSSSAKSTPATTPEDIPPMTPPKDYPPSGGQVIPSLDATREKVDRVMSPSSRRNQPTTTTATTSSPKTGDKTPEPAKESGSPDDVSESPMDRPRAPSISEIATPTIEISIARSVSLSRGHKRTVVPLKPRQDQLKTADERLVVGSQPLVPTVVDVRRAHEPEKSQDVLIETV